MRMHDMKREEDAVEPELPADVTLKVLRVTEVALLVVDSTGDYRFIPWRDVYTLDYSPPKDAPRQRRLPLLMKATMLNRLVKEHGLI